MATSLPRNPSVAFMLANPKIYKPADNAAAVGKIKSVAKRGMSAPALNKTEQRWQDENPFHIPFAISLRWGKTMRYKPDFFVPIGWSDSVRHRLIEVKGAHIYDRDIVRFKGCAAEWDRMFDFELHQWKNGEWTRLY